MLCVQRHGLTIAIDLLERDKSGSHVVYDKTFIDIADAEPYIYQLCRRNKLHVIKKGIGGFFDDLMFESGKLFKTNEGKILKFNESTDGISLSDIYSALKKEYDGKLFSDNFINLAVEQEGSQVVVKPELEIPDDLDLGNQDDYEWWQDKIDSTSLLYDEVVKFLVDKYGEIFQYNEIGVSDEYIDKTNFDGQFVIDNDQEDDDSPFVVTICEK